MATLDPIVFNRLRNTIDDFTDAAHRLVLQLDGEIVDSVDDEARSNLRHLRALIADLGLRLDMSDPDGSDATGAWGIIKDTNIDRNSAYRPH